MRCLYSEKPKEEEKESEIDNLYRENQIFHEDFKKPSTKKYCTKDILLTKCTAEGSRSLRLRI